MATAFRPEIQGLRGIAALLVASYHIWFGRVSGGVDIFFVVSGFLITHSLLNQRARNGRVEPGRFLRDLYARLGPPALLVVVLTAIGSELFLPRADWPFNIREAVSAAFFVNNWHLALNAVSYLDRSSDPRPFQHFWALSVQWQFYFLWAAIFVLIHRLRPDQFRKTLAASIGTLFLVSFVYSVYLTAHNQPLAYFNTATRVWEFAAGGLLALLQPQASSASRTGVVLGWLGLVTIVACGAVLPVSSSFPGYAALVPVIAAVLILSFGSSEHPASVRRLLSWQPLAAFGRISYPFYLWHWPILVLWLSYTMEAHASLRDGLVILIAALALSLATHLLMQVTWTRSWRPLSGRVAATLTGLTVIYCMGWRAEVSDAKSMELASAPPPTSTHPGALAIGHPPKPYAPVPGPFAVRNDFPAAYADGCDQTTTGTEVITCVYGDPQGKVTIAAIGNSHITHWLPALDPAGKERGWRIVIITKDDCQLGRQAGEAPDDTERSCDQWNDRLVDVVRDLAPDYIFVAATRREGNRELFPTEYRMAWRRLVPDQSRIIAVRGTPRFPFDVPDCVDLHGQDSPRCSIPLSTGMGEASLDLRAAVEQTGASFVDLTRYFCDERRCFPAAGNVLIYRDHNHLTATYARTMRNAVAMNLDSAMNRAD